ncbi:Glutathione-dependent formaldehyde-activating enzyme [Roseivivax sp. THAF40]|uniref:GFA family protein n=1 Tax=unclassified Roseivivax TaxID=2639302 RepID=UPI0012680D41|nr:MULTISPECIES: GFA family protein [unclassified Roseivivax]QFS82110.1 Glutathione-dependent formaldehyde-activating enzyme [Roseivivax sp. THAF197b]QFT45910.1 Glutathione-dependent formaldehyde-activating enzyme [Roseivivax sp. THAF40]
MTPEAAGSCLCGAIRYEVFAKLRPVVGCHCTQCRKTSGHHVAATAADPAHVAITGTPRWFRSSEAAERGFCPTCGSNLFWRRPGHLSIFAGTLDTHAADLTLAGHIFCADKGRYYEIADGTRQSPGQDATLAPPAR